MSFLLMSLFCLYLANIVFADNPFGCKKDLVIEGSLPNSELILPRTKAHTFTASAQPLSTNPSDVPELLFAVEKLHSAKNPTDRRFVLQLGLLANENDSNNSFIFGTPVDTSPALSDALRFKDGLFNCYIDRNSHNNPCQSGAQNPRCCYDDFHGSVQEEMSDLFPTCTANPCPGLQILTGSNKASAFSCRAICYYDMIIQVEFADSTDQDGQILLTTSMLGSRVSLLQKNGQFTEIERDLGDSYFKSLNTQKGSYVTKDQVVGFWLKWIEFDKYTPVLELGHDGSEIPFFSHRFDQFCFDCESKDSNGWSGKEVQLPRASRVFKPKDCDNIVYSRYQTQKLHGTCLSNRQCTKKCSDLACTARKCLPDLQLPSSNRRTCQVPPPPEFPLEIGIILFLLALLIFICLILICCVCYYIGSTKPKLRQAKSYKIDVPENTGGIPSYIDHSVQSTKSTSVESSLQSFGYMDHSFQS